MKWVNACYRLADLIKKEQGTRNKVKGALFTLYPFSQLLYLFVALINQIRMSMNRQIENMNLEDIKEQVRYLTNQQGKTTNVLVPLETWNTILQALTEENDETDSKNELIADLKQSLLDAQKGNTFPLEELWEGIEE